MIMAKPQMESDPTDDSLSSKANALIHSAFDNYLSEFVNITRRAKSRFEKRDWKGIQDDSRERLDIYERALDRIAPGLTALLRENACDRSLWVAMKKEYPAMFAGRHDLDLAQTFFNSVTRKMFSTVGLDREIEFFQLEAGETEMAEVGGVYRRYPKNRDTRYLVQDILLDHKFEIRYESVERDAEVVAREIDLHLWPLVGYQDYQSIDIINSHFYRNKVAYLVGRICAGARCIPLIIPLYNGDNGVYVDTVLLNEAEASIVFSFAHSYFQVVVERHDELIRFLKTILPEKPISELYVSIGYNRHGKTEFYRDLHRFVHRARGEFVIAPGREGAVMIVFTMQNYDYVFKVIKDGPCFLRTPDETPKTTTKPEVMYQYSFVCHRDRVGRMVDTQEFENLRFKKGRFSEQLLGEFAVAARDTVSIEGDYVVIHHLYIQRKVMPLLLYLQHQCDAEAVRRVIVDFGFFLKDLAASGIFPSDLFNVWNYGVTRRGRVVLFDYDDVTPLEKINFRIKPQPQDEFEEMEPEQDWVVVMPGDYFIDEMERYSGLPPSLRPIFKAYHDDIYTLEFWRDMQRRIHEGEIVDITPYDRSKRFSR